MSEPIRIGIAGYGNLGRGVGRRDVRHRQASAAVFEQEVVGNAKSAVEGVGKVHNLLFN